MNAYKLAQKHLASYSSSYSNSINELIKPTCDLLTKNGFITLHSCSTHVRVRTYRIRNIENAPYSGKPNIAKQWYILFVATKSIKEFRELIYEINSKYDYYIKFEKTPYVIDGKVILTRRWLIEFITKDNFNEEFVYELNKNIYNEFNNFFNKKATI